MASGHRRPRSLDQCMRWGQLTLVDNDPGRFDPQFWLDYFDRTHCDGVCLSAGGCLAYYPTDVPLHRRSAWMGERDPFGELVAGCRAMGMAVLARTDPHACADDAAQAHPEWVSRDAQGQPRRHPAYPEKYWLTCTLGPYNFEFMTQVTCEIVERYDIDGVFCNRWADTRYCYCESCRTGFREATGGELPRHEAADDPLWARYVQWWQRRMFELWDLCDERIRRIKPGACFVPNVGGGATSWLDMVSIGRRAVMGAADRQARRGVMPPWAAGKNAKEYRATFGRRGVAGIFSVGIEEPHRWKDSVQSEAELRLWAINGIANGLRPWYTKFAGYLHDRRWLEPVQRLYEWHHDNEAYLAHESSLARVAMVYSQQTALHYGRSHAYEKLEEPALGFYQALIEARIPFDMVHDAKLDERALEPYKLLILPNIAAMSDEQAAQLRRFVERGGSIVASFETSLYDEQGRRRDDFALADLFGARCDGVVQGPLQNAYLRLEHATAHPVLAGLEAAPRIIHGTHRVPVQEVGRVDARPVTLVPPYPDLPMEEVYPRQERTEQAELFLRELAGGGRVAYFNWDVGRAFWRFLCVDHGRLLGNTVRWALNEPAIVEVQGAGVIEVVAWRQARSMTVHLVNLTNPMMMKGPCRELLPSPPQQVFVRAPAGCTMKDVRLLVSGEKPAVQRRDGGVALKLGPIVDHEVVAIDLELAGR